MDNFPDKIELKLEQPYYDGSVQKLYEVPGHPELLISETSVGGSVFDVGTIFSIEESDTGRAGFRHLVFQELQDPDAWSNLSKDLSSRTSVLSRDSSGTIEKVLAEFCSNGAPTHHAGMVDRESGEVFPESFPSKLSNLTLIKKYEIAKPELRKVAGWHFYDYEQYHRKDRNVVPLEYIVRLGVTSGSSILKKYNRLSESNQSAYLNELGVDALTPWTRFDPPIVDLTTKYEPEDRNISRQEAALISGLDGETFGRSMVMAMLGAFLLQQIFSKMGLTLWDLKWEIARDGNKLLFVDTIDTDSVRVTYDVSHNDKTYFVHFNKQAMRDYYKIMHTDWLNGVNEAKKAAEKTGQAFTEILKEGQENGTYPANPDVDEKFLDIQKKKFEMVQHFLRNREQDLKDETAKIAFTELDYYDAAGKLGEYELLNSI